jgi:molecular chaperone GrpE
MEEENNIKKDELEEKGKSFDAAQDKLKELELKCEEYLNGWKRERADFLNHKKEEMERIGIIIKYANEELILKILPILDNFCLAEKHLPEDKEFKNGFSQIKKQLEDFLQKEGIEVIKTLGEPFDANFMEAVGTDEGGAEGADKGSTVESGGTGGTPSSDEVVEEVQRGYTLHGKVIRPAKVRVTK